MHLQEVTSSKLLRVGYDEAKQILVVQFPEGKQGVYAYLGVDPLLYDAMMEAESKGSYFIKNIRGKNGAPIHTFRKVGDGDILLPDGQLADAYLSFAEDFGRPFIMDKPKGMPLPPAPDIQRAATKGEVLPPAKYDTVLELPADDEELKKTAKTIAVSVQDQAHAFKVTDGLSFANASAWIVTIKQQRKMIYDRLDRIVTPLLTAYREAQKLRDEAAAPLDEAERILKASMLTYSRQEEAQRRRLEQEETARRQEQARKDAEDQARQQAEEDARTFEAQGEPEMAASVRANPLPVAPVRVAPVVLEREVPRGASSVREKWVHRVIDASKIPLTHEFYTLDEKKLANRAKTLKQHGTIQGVLECYDEGTIATRIA